MEVLACSPINININKMDLQGVACPLATPVLLYLNPCSGIQGPLNFAHFDTTYFVYSVEISHRGCVAQSHRAIINNSKAKTMNALLTEC